MNYPAYFLHNHSTPPLNRTIDAPFVFSDDGVGINYPPLFRNAIQQAKKEKLRLHPARRGRKHFIQWCNPLWRCFTRISISR